MKFKHLIIIFNIVIIFFLSAVALLPVLFMGSDFALVFWQSGWPLALILVLALVVLNVFFLQNYRLFMLLEREDWPALVDHLEQTVLGKGRYSYRRVRLLVNSYLVMSDSAAVLRLESKVAIAKPALLESNALAFGAARILGGDLKGAAEFFQTRLEKGKAAETQWIRWFYGFSLVLASVFDKAEGEFKALASASNDAIIAGLSAYFLANTLLKHSLNPAECRSLADGGHERVKKTLKNIEGWKKEAAKVETEVHAAIIKKYIDEAGIWLFRA
ncbi:hypothetical protein AGMMS50293_08410 [Spirochaetia bacterium]|nr:hypothetical protein AGMMS50293_08410 [Spirochaetia bacterium]